MIHLAKKSSPLILPDKYRTRERERRGEKLRVEKLIKWVFCDTQASEGERERYMMEIRMFCHKDPHMVDFTMDKIKYYAGDSMSSFQFKEIGKILERDAS